MKFFWNNSQLTTQIVQKEGFDGLIAIEGGEGDEIGEHDSYVIFNPDNVNLTL